MTVGELGTRMSSWELTMWQIFLRERASRREEQEKDAAWKRQHGYE